MNKERELELLAYAKVCFARCTNPFAHIHLSKKEVDSDECGDISMYIADLLENEIDLRVGDVETAKLVAQAEREFDETQQDL